MNPHIHWFGHVPFENPGILLKLWEEEQAKVTATYWFQDKQISIPENPDLLVIMGGPMGVYDEDKFPWLKDELLAIEKAIKSGIPLLGICLGAQLISRALGAKVYKAKEKEIGFFPIYSETNIPDSSLPKEIVTFHWHGDTFDLPQNCTRLYRSEPVENQAYMHNSLPIVGLQFHPEITLEGIENLIKHCADDLSPSKYTQPPEQMKSTYPKVKAENKDLLTKILQLIETDFT
ncbi:MAG: amidotransferase [Candidatus Hydrogenedentota bacterium]|nr:MAG: amidotransferase [Candidatus Hydrogenedentota bacterium]